MSSEISSNVLAGKLFIKVTELFIKVTEFPMFELTLSPVFDCCVSNLENFSFELCEWEEIQENSVTTVGTKLCQFIFLGAEGD